MTARRLLIRGGDVIDTEPEPVLHRGTDVLVEDGLIRAVGPDLHRDGHAEIIDATNRFVLPGFVDTHRHLWQTGLRSLVVDDGFDTYLDLVLRRTAPRLRPEDMHIATLAGALECLDAGITTVQDYSVMYAFDHGEAAVTALRSAGIRAVYGAGFPVFDESARRPRDVRRLRDAHFPGEGLLTMALAPVGPSFTRIELVEQDWQLADELGVPIAVHVNSGPVAERPIATLREHGLLRPDTLYIHGNNLPDEELRLVADSGAAFSITPLSEVHFRQGPPMIARLRAAGITTGLGVDVVTTVAGDMFTQMRGALHTEHLPAADVLRLATVDGARALGLVDRTGSLHPGKDADLILLRADTPNLLATHDPIAAVVTAAHPGNVDTVLVAGHIVKRAGQLLHPDLPQLPAGLRRSADHLLEPAPA